MHEKNTYYYIYCLPFFSFFLKTTIRKKKTFKVARNLSYEMMLNQIDFACGTLFYHSVKVIALYQNLSLEITS